MIWSLLHRLRFWGAALVFAVFVLSLPYAAHVQIDPSNESVFVRNSSYFDNEWFLNHFENDESIVVGMGPAEIFSKPVLEWIRRFSEETESWDGVGSVMNILRLRSVQRKGRRITVAPVAAEYLKGQQTESTFKSALLKVPELTHLLLGPEQKFSSVILLLKPGMTSQERHQLVEKTRNWLEMEPVPEGSVYLSGTAVEQDAFVSRIQQDHRLFVPVTFAVILMALVLLNGHLSDALFPATVILATVASTQALMKIFNQPLNVVTSLVSPVILIVSVSDSVHIQSYARHMSKNLPPATNLKRLFVELGMPCLLTTLTTMAGFASLSLNAVPAVRQFGIFSAAGTGLALIWTLALTPLFFHWHVAWTHKTKTRRWRLLSSALSSWIASYWRQIITVGFVLFLGGLFFSRWIHIETDILSSFKSNDPFRRNTELIHEKLGGIYPLELVLSAPKNQFWNAETLQQAVQFKEEVAELPGVSHARYITDLLNAIDREVNRRHQENRIPSQPQLERYLNGLDQNAPNEISSLALDHFAITRMSVFLKESNTAMILGLTSKIRSIFERILPETWHLLVTGQVFLLASMSQHLVQSELIGIVIAFTAVLIMMVILFRSFWAGTLAVLVNCLPIALVFGSMPLLQIPLNTATATIGSVSIGLIVDNAIHVLHRYHQIPFKFLPKLTLRKVINYCAQPLVSSAVMLSAGFSVTLLGSIQPTIYFGLLMILATLFALAANLVILPALIFLGLKSGKTW